MLTEGQQQGLRVIREGRLRGWKEATPQLQRWSPEKTFMAGNQNVPRLQHCWLPKCWDYGVGA